MNNTLPVEWLAVLDADAKATLARATAAAEREATAGKHIFPSRADWFAAFHHVAPSNVRVVILGQDPYHDDGQGHGLCFSVLPGVKPPPSLANIFKELQADQGHDPPTHGHLVRWAEQGVLLLNTVLTVRAHSPGSHKNKGWEKFTDAVIRALSDRSEPIVFALWGDFAKKKASLVDQDRHRVVLAPHPSPIAAKGPRFVGSRPFTAINDALAELGSSGIDWDLG